MMQSAGGGVFFYAGYFSASVLSMSGNVAVGSSTFGDMGGLSKYGAVCTSDCSPGERGNCSFATGGDSCAINCGCVACLHGVRLEGLAPASQLASWARF